MATAKRRPLTKDQARWVKALRSGKYRQGRGSLLEIEGRAHHYCCLGVACRVFLGPSEDGEWGGEHMWLPVELQRLLGMRCPSGTFDGQYYLVGNMKARSLAEANDRLATFAEIADFIEANPEIVFPNTPKA